VPKTHNNDRDVIIPSRLLFYTASSIVDQIDGEDMLYALEDITNYTTVKCTQLTTLLLGKGHVEVLRITSEQSLHQSKKFIKIAEEFNIPWEIKNLV
jgi:hypothetical protein